MGTKTKARPELLTSYKETSPFAEAYRVLRFNLLPGNGKPLWSVGVTGAGVHHGSSTTAANLGLIMAETGNRVVLVDADLYKPSLHRVFNIPNDVGFSTVLQGQAQVQSALKVVTDPELLKVLPAGPRVQNPTALLKPAVLAGFFDLLKNEADLLILDLPSVGAIAYTSFLASLLDGLLLVVRAGTSSGGVDRIMKRRLQGVNVLGVVLNQVPVDGSDVSAYRHYA